MKPNRSFRDGFTLVELMGAMAIGMVVLLVAVGMLSSTGDGYERLGGGIGAEREARALLSQITSDLAGAQFHEEMLFNEGLQKWPIDRMGFLTLQPEDSQLEENRLGDLCAVRYYTRDEKMGGKTVRCLVRGITESNETFAKLRSGSIGSLFDEPATGSGGTSESNTDETIAFGVVSFEARPKTRNGDGRLTDWVKGGDRGPDVIAIKLIIARRELMGKMSSSADWSGDGIATVSQLGLLSEATRNKNFQVYETTVRFGYPNERK